MLVKWLVRLFFGVVMMAVVFAAPLKAIASKQITISPSSLHFDDQKTGTESAAQVVVLTNTADTTIYFSHVTLDTNDYEETNTCAGGLTAGASCTIAVVFSPKAIGAASGGMYVSFTNAPYRYVSVSGAGVDNGTDVDGRRLDLSSDAMTFRSPAVNIPSALQYVTLTNNGQVDIHITYANVSSSAFRLSNDCVGLLAAGQSCNVTVDFLPLFTSGQSGELHIYADTPEGHYTITLYGEVTAGSDGAAAAAADTDGVSGGCSFIPKRGIEGTTSTSQISNE